MTVRVEWLGVREFVAALDRMSTAMTEAGGPAVAAAAKVLQAEAKAQASGRPGPNVISGDLRSSIVIDGPSRRTPWSWEALVGPTTRYGRRIELGFRGTDSLGRHFDQPPYPFLSPAFTAATEAMFTACRASWAAAWGRL